jgi:hypothetical protein
MRDDISNEAQFGGARRGDASHPKPPVSPSVRVFLGGANFADGEDGVDWNTLTPGIVPWDEDPAVLLRYVANLLASRVAFSAAHVWYVYAEQGYDQRVLLGSFGLHPDSQDRLAVVESIERCPHMRFVHCERIPVAALEILGEAELKGCSDGPYATHLQTTLQAEAVMYTHYVPCHYTYSDEEVARELAKVEAKNEVRKPVVVYPLTIAALVLGAILMMVLKVGLWPGASAVVGSVLLLFVLPIAGSIGAIALVGKRMEASIARDILAKRLPVGEQRCQHDAVFSYGPLETLYTDEGTSRRFGVGTETFMTTVSFVLVSFEDGTLIPVSKAAL